MTDDLASPDASSDGSDVGELYDWWSRHPRALETMYDIALFGRDGAIRDRSLAMLDVTPGERVLEVGCGFGNSFSALREAAGPEDRVDAGTTIRWENTDGVFHTVTSTDDLENRSGGGDRFDAQLSSEGDTFGWPAEEPGRQDYYCSPHAGFMYGSIEIE